MEHVKAVRNGTTARFPLSVWKSGIPAKAGWQLITEEQKVAEVIPKEIVDMSIKKKAEITEVPGVATPTTEKKKDAEPAVNADAKPEVKKSEVKKPAKPRKPRASKK